MIAHIEKGMCQKIDQDDFQGHIQHKKIIKSILEQPERTIGKPSPAAATTPAVLPSPNPAEASQYLTVVGNNQYNSHESQLSVTKEDDGAANPESAQTGAKENVSENMQSLGSNLANISLETNSTNNSFAEAATRSNNQSNSHKASSSVINNNSNPHSTTWGANASTSLFPKAKATPLTQDWEATLERDHARAAQPRNMFRIRFWDPLSDDYDPEQFFDAAEQRYNCPIPDCR